jgi:pantoate--beta-alanine ligase
MTLVTCNTIADLYRTLAPHWQSGTTIGLVPTLGALHDGHLAHVHRARARDAVVVVSIFVNPTQFGPTEDLARYPRTPEQDLAQLRAAQVDVVFMPAAGEMYPPGAATRVDVGFLGTILEGARRPGHFSGVATVVTKLLNLVRPTRAYFGQKDAQQVAVIERLVSDLNMPVEIVVGETVREPDGLAMSSRNRYLSPAERGAATALYRALTAADAAYGAGECEAARLRQVMREAVEAEPLARLDYAEVVDGTTWEMPATAGPACLLVIAAWLGGTRLIDNLLLTRVGHRETRQGER